MTRKRLNELLDEYAYSAYWHGEDTGCYGKQNPDVYEETEKEL